MVAVLLVALATMLPTTLASTTAHAAIEPTTAIAATPPATLLSTTDPEPPPSTLPERSIPPITVNEFLPEDANLSDCVGFVERPGCGSEARGGLQQTLIFVALAAGLAIIFWRVSVGVRRNRQGA